MLSLTKTEMFEIIAAQFPLWDTSENADLDIAQPHLEAVNALTEDLPILGHDFQHNIHMDLKNAVRQCPTTSINEDALTQILKTAYLQAANSLKQYPAFDIEKATQLSNIIITAMVRPCVVYNNLASVPSASAAVIISKPQLQNVNEVKHVNEAKQMLLGYIDDMKTGLQSDDIDVIKFGTIMADIVRPQEVQFTQDELQEMIAELENLNKQCATSTAHFLASAIQEAIKPCLNLLMTRQNSAAPSGARMKQ
jgi:hypothetical protein